ncbi:MAG: hypothetical protein DSM107014_01970 [Gomphosphaeria aponina SAG 52.96 = DSM 107014]|uniref:Double-GTPase 1 domain-containing protein n=1 Tax=Gomphosphaeria aponina SAG 52.96 = DSM 107014 TaxID=1521640 RepID=A0A941GRG9_9CHRO|nr:hypothetical protein [Gomphosphaeria aponina SAG 52.96 = DSM 107014]
MAETVDLRGSGDIRIIGGRGSGKTTFMAALAYWPNSKPNSPIESVQPFDSETQILCEMARNLLENGQPLPPTRQPRLYSLIITLKPGWSNPIIKITGKNLRLEVSCQDYAGELLTLLRNRLDEQIVMTYLDDCAAATGILLLVDGSSHKLDQEYSQALENMKRELDYRFSSNNRNKREYRLAWVFSKAEQGGVWSHRNNIENFAGLKFPKTKKVLSQWRKDWNCQTASFFCSAFGFMGNNRPNVKVINRGQEGVSAVIEQARYWQPVGLIEPIYWLHTGRGDARLRAI